MDSCETCLQASAILILAAEMMRARSSGSVVVSTF